MPRNAVSPSRCICQLFGICRMECGVMVVMERLKCSVHELIHNPDFCLTVPLCLQISHEIAIGIAFLHRNSVMHRVSGGARVEPMALYHMACMTCGACACGCMCDDGAMQPCSICC